MHELAYESGFWHLGHGASEQDKKEVEGPEEDIERDEQLVHEPEARCVRHALLPLGVSRFGFGVWSLGFGSEFRTLCDRSWRVWDLSQGPITYHIWDLSQGPITLCDRSWRVWIVGFGAWRLF